MRGRNHVLCLLALACLSAPALANRFVVDGIHGQQYLGGWCGAPDLDSLYPGSRFAMLGVEQLPLYEVLAQGVCGGGYEDSVIFTVPEGAAALYVIADEQTARPPRLTYYPQISLRTPTQAYVRGSYGMAHLDAPPPGAYVLRAGTVTGGPSAYRIGTGPSLWDVYPPADYDAVLNFQLDTWGFWVGRPQAYSAGDLAALQGALAQGGGVGLFYDGAEPVALKPIIRLRDFTRQGASVRIDVPGYPFYAAPEPHSRLPLRWELPPSAGEVELDYEARFRRPLNFVWCAPGGGTVQNRSWAAVHGLRLIEFVAGKGYRVRDLGTLAPGAAATLPGGTLFSGDATFALLDRALRADALAAGLTSEESESFQERCHWALRLLPRISSEPGVLALYRIEGADYDALFPLTTVPVPAERVRVLWVDAWLPARVSAPAAVHPPLAVPPQDGGEPVGTFHEYGFFRETYGGDALDELDAWGWHFYDQMLMDCTDALPDEPYGGNSGYYFDTWGTSPIAAALSPGVTRVAGCIISGIEAPAHEVILSGDEDTTCDSLYGADPECPFPPGSFPPVIVGREEPGGGRLLATGDISLLDTLADNEQFGRNLWDWLHGVHTEGAPDVDLPDAVADLELPQGGAGELAAWIHNRGDVLLQTNILPPAAEWLSVTGPSLRSLAAGDSFGYTLHFAAGSLEPGYYMAWGQIITDDPNEDTLRWPVRLHVLGAGNAGPHGTPLPRAFVLHAPYPNPFNPATTIAFDLAQAGVVRLELCNLLGQRVAEITSAHWPAGTHALRLDLSAHAAGLYFVRAEAAGSVTVRKLVLMK